MSRTIILAATQMACCWDLESNLETAEGLVRKAAGQGGQIILLQELFEVPYFCKDQKPEYFRLAHPAKDHPVLRRMQVLAASLHVVLPVSFFELANQVCYNSLAMIDADGSLLGIYRKSHIPDGPGYQEKYYFNPGDTGFQVWETRYARVGAAVCWDQWFPECARILALKGAEVLLYPTAIGSEPQDASLDSRDHWQHTMQGHAAANMLPLVASNRIGSEAGEGFTMTFYGSSFITDDTGAVIAQASRDRQEVLTASFDLDAIRERRLSWGLFRDRRPDLYSTLLSLDGSK